MGELVLAAKTTHVPSIWLSEQPGPTQGIRQNAIDGLRELGRRGRERGVETYVVLDVHWQVTIGFHVNGKERHAGEYTSHEIPHFIDGLAYDYAGDPKLAEGIRTESEGEGLACRCHSMEGLTLEYGTLIPMRHIDPEAQARVVPVAANVNALIEDQRRFGAAIRAAVQASDRKVGLVASGSLSHAFWPNHKAEQGLNEVSSPFNEMVDHMVLDLWREGRMADFVRILPEYAERCSGEALMADTAVLFGALGWDAYQGRGEVLGEYFGSTGTGQCNVDFSLEGSRV